MITVVIFQFQEDGNIIIYSPAFDLTGYGKDLIEAKHSFEEALDEFIDYTIKKKTFLFFSGDLEISFIMCTFVTH